MENLNASPKVTLVHGASQAANDPVQQPRTKFITRLEEQKLLLQDPNHIGTVQRWTKGKAGIVVPSRDRLPP